MKKSERHLPFVSQGGFVEQKFMNVKKDFIKLVVEESKKDEVEHPNKFHNMRAVVDQSGIEPGEFLMRFHSAIRGGSYSSLVKALKLPRQVF